MECEEIVHFAFLGHKVLRAGILDTASVPRSSWDLLGCGEASHGRFSFPLNRKAMLPVACSTLSRRSSGDGESHVAFVSLQVVLFSVKV